MKFFVDFSRNIEASCQEIFRYCERESFLARITPPFKKIEVVNIQKGLEVGSIFYVKVAYARWSGKVCNVQKPHLIEMEFSKSFFKKIHQRILIQKISETQSELRFEFEGEVKGAFFAKIFFNKFGRKFIERVINYHYETMICDLKNSKKLSAEGVNKKILLSGSSGLIGGQLRAVLDVMGYDVYTLVRRNKIRSDEIYWNPEKKLINKADLEGFYAVIHLGGESIFGFRWSEGKKKRILDSRINSTSFLAKSLNDLSYPPKVFMCASAIGYYGDAKDQVCTEASLKGSGFLSDVVSLWEEASNIFSKSRVINLRFGVVLHAGGGVLKKLAFPFSTYFGAILGSGRQFFSWISLDDLCYSICHLLKDQQIKGAVNLVSPEATTNKEFSKELAQCYKKRVWLKIPSLILKILFGESSSLFLSSTKAYPKKMIESSFEFSYAKLHDALKHTLGK
jgi:uncharacterized protein (TIGR01777 family)